MAFSFRHIFCIFHDVSLAAITTCSSHTTPPTEKGIKPSGFTREKPPKHEVTGLVTPTNSLYVSPALNSIYGSHALFLIHCTTLLYRLYFMIFVPNNTKVWYNFSLWTLIFEDLGLHGKFIYRDTISAENKLQDYNVQVSSVLPSISLKLATWLG